MAANEDMNPQLLTGRILHTAHLVAIASYIMILVLAQLEMIDFYIFSTDDPAFSIITGTVAVMGVLSVICGIYLPRWLIKRLSRGVGAVFTVSIIRWSFFQATLIYGLILGILGAGWQVILPFFIIGAIALILSAPTKERWQRMMK